MINSEFIRGSLGSLRLTPIFWKYTVTFKKRTFFLYLFTSAISLYNRRNVVRIYIIGLKSRLFSGFSSLRLTLRLTLRLFFRRKEISIVNMAVLLLPRRRATLCQSLTVATRPLSIFPQCLRLLPPRPRLMGQ